ncbi:hypothetical protein [Qingshengfaniella alkalisoli]|nr:hypothetical protein [Qingshengfaniella alkalisoli]
MMNRIWLLGGALLLAACAGPNLQSQPYNAPPAPTVAPDVYQDPNAISEDGTREDINQRPVPTTDLDTAFDNAMQGM